MLPPLDDDDGDNNDLQLQTVSTNGMEEGNDLTRLKEVRPMLKQNINISNI